MKYTVIVGGNPYVVLCDQIVKNNDGTVDFMDFPAGGQPSRVAEFNGSKIDGIISEDNNVS